MPNKTFICSLVNPEPPFTKAFLKDGMKISARGAKAAAEVFILGDYPEGIRFKPKVVQVKVEPQNHDGPTRIFEITTVISAKCIKTIK